MVIPLPMALAALVLLGGGLYLGWHQFFQPKGPAAATVAQDTKGTTDHGGVVDNTTQADAQAPTPSNNPTPAVSASGAITLSQPTSGGLLTTGSAISGTAQVPRVQYRIKDPAVGVISTGSLQVSGGAFSGTASLSQAQSETGTLEIYSFDSQGAEQNRAKVAVRFR